MSDSKMCIFDIVMETSIFYSNIGNLSKVEHIIMNVNFSIDSLVICIDELREKLKRYTNVQGKGRGFGVRKHVQPRRILVL